METPFARLEELAADARGRLVKLEDFAADTRGRLTNLEGFAVDARAHFARLEELVIDAHRRLAKLEDFALEARERMIKIEARLDQTATKAEMASLRAEMQRGFADMIKWIVGTAIGITATGIVVMTFVLNNAVPKAPAAPSAPITIYAQPAGAVPAPAAKP